MRDRSFIDPFLDGIDAVLAWFSTELKQTVESYSDLETAEDTHTLVARDGSLISVIRVYGVTKLIGQSEFDSIHQGLTQSLQATFKRPGHVLQVYFGYDRDGVKPEIQDILSPARATAKRLNLDLDDLFNERVNYISQYCAREELYFVLWTRPYSLTNEQLKRASKDKLNFIRQNKIKPFKNGQNLIAAIPDLRESHKSFVRSLVTDLNALNLYCTLLEVHDAVFAMRYAADPEFTAKEWRPVLPGDKIPLREISPSGGEMSGLMYPPLARQVFPRDATTIDLRTARVGDRIYSPLFIELFPQDLKSFMSLFARTLPTRVPWRMSFLIESGGLATIRFKSVMAAILSFTSAQNGLVHDAAKLLREIEVNTDDAVVKLQVSLATWAPEGNIRLLRTRIAELAKAVEGWGTCEVGEVSGDIFAGLASSLLGFTANSVATPTVAPLTDVVYMLPFTRPASAWEYGALLLRSPDGKPWPYQPGSAQQTTWIDLMYARPGSGKSVLSNTLNLALCLSGGITRLPRIAIIDIGPSSSGLISLLKEALPQDQKHFAAYHRLRMTPDYSINPFDTQLGCRYPSPQERSFLVNFVTLLATPVGAERPYDGISDMAGLIVDEMYKYLADEGKAHPYTQGIEVLVDDILTEIGFVFDDKTTWWEVTDALFLAGFHHEALLAQRYAMPLLADAAAIVRTQVVEDLYGQVRAPTGEPLIQAFSRMISSAVREYPILSNITKFDIGDARIVSLDLDEVAKSGGDAAERQTAVMYMIARYALARHYYLTEDILTDIPDSYREYHRTRISEIREDAKRIVYDEFHRTSKARAVRDQVIIDMREGRKWNVQIALISQSLDDFDPVMVEFGTSIFIMDAGPELAIKRSTEIFGLSETARIALKNRVHGPREGGATFLAQFATKSGMNTQLLTNTLGPIELWAFSTTAEDTRLRNKLYQKLGPKEARRILANLFSSGSVKSLIETRLSELKESQGVIEEDANLSVVDQLMEEILEAYSKNPEVKSLST
ncbi:MAG: type IV secretion protein IcmB [Gammaproteobacteria bacterium RIFCSPHIGHO2_12_FULL_38_14]|nr:MAG: type IV secretion protein IcmB [Gammaproteobacteria bacterium RIFCSPHIGHO2_12_FULL_38_14]